MTAVAIAELEPGAMCRCGHIAAKHPPAYNYSRQRRMCVACPPGKCLDFEPETRELVS